MEDGDTGVATSCANLTVPLGNWWFEQRMKSKDRSDRRWVKWFLISPQQLNRGTQREEFFGEFFDQFVVFVLGCQVSLLKPVGPEHVILNRACESGWLRRRARTGSDHG